ncbi:MAG: hypothetical protein IKK05_05155 [Alistipes sp.]|nr:hypothetical protein [Alistipes sp.]
MKYLMLLWVGILSASCIFDEERCVISPDVPHDITFTVSLEGQRTRASWGEGYPSEVGVPFDYRIIPDELRVVVFTDDDERLGQVSDIYYWPINQEHTEFQFTGKMPVEFVDHINAFGAENPIYRFMVFANCGDSAIGEEYITYSQSQLDPANENSAIPMWGVTEADVTPLLDDNNLDLGTISLLRAAAKVEVELTDKLKDGGTKINSATLKYYNQTGYVLPSGWSQVAKTQHLDQEECIRVYRHAAINMPFVVDEEGGYCHLYVTEYDNIQYLGERNKISFEFNVGGEDKYFEDAISFCEYSDGKKIEGTDYNITRNHIYRFTVRSIAGESLMLEYHVADWDAEDWGNNKEYKEHDITYPTYLNPLVPYDYIASTDQKNYVITKSPKMYFSGNDNLEEGAFVAYFKILSPSSNLEAVQWKPGFMASKENYRIRVYHIEDGVTITGLVFDSGGDSDLQKLLPACEANDWYKIVIFPLSADGAQSTTVDLGISYYQEWTDQYINLFINGEYGNIRWPNSGTNPKIIEIKHVAQPIN